jgi:L-fuculose-phosphate aldolase
MAAGKHPKKGGDISPPEKKLNSQSPKAALKAFFNSAFARGLKEQLCTMGRRQWQREYVDGNGGNMAIRVGADLALCTPTSVSKGFMKPEDICLVDFEGNQIAGKKTRTSEILMHLAIMKRQPRAVATCHCHPPYATGFAIAGVVPPTRHVPEYEIYASVAIAPYHTPGQPEMSRLIAEFADQHNTILMTNHGVVSWSHLDIEDAYFKMEIIEAYCRTVLVTAQLGVPAKKIAPHFVKELLERKKGLGIPDPRHALKESELRYAEWFPGEKKKSK